MTPSVRRAFCALAVTLVPLVAACDPENPATWPHAAQMLIQPEQTPEHAVSDHTGVVEPVLASLYTTAELVAAGSVTLNWADHRDGFEAALVPDHPRQFHECSGADLCVLIQRPWWEASGWPDQEGANRTLVAHEYGHVLSARRKAADATYAEAVSQVWEECLADAVAALVLSRGGFPPAVTEGYNVAYDCERYWQDRYGESRQMQANILAESLLRWAVTGQVVEINGPAVAGAPAVRCESSDLVLGCLALWTST